MRLVELAHQLIDAIFNGLDDDDKQGWNETIRMVYGWDYIAEEANANKEYDFF